MEFQNLWKQIKRNELRRQRKVPVTNLLVTCVVWTTMQAHWVIGCWLPAANFWVLLKSRQLVMGIFAFGFSCNFLTCLHLVGSSFEMFAGKVRFELRLVHFGHLAAVHHSWRTLSPYLHVGLQGRDWHWTSLDYWLSTDLFLSPPHCRLATWTYLLQFVFTSPQSIKSQNRHVKNESPGGGNRCHKPSHAASDHSQSKRHLAAAVVNKRQSRIEQEAV